MIENLLWPTKLKQPPKLDVNPAAMFGKIKFEDPTYGIEEKKYLYSRRIQRTRERLFSSRILRIVQKVTYSI